MFSTALARLVCVLHSLVRTPHCLLCKVSFHSKKSQDLSPISLAPRVHPLSDNASRLHISLVLSALCAQPRAHRPTWKASGSTHRAESPPCPRNQSCRDSMTRQNSRCHKPREEHIPTLPTQSGCPAPRAQTPADSRSGEQNLQS